MSARPLFKPVTAAMSARPLVKVGDMFTIDPMAYLLGHGPFEWPEGRQSLYLRVTHVPDVKLSRTDWVALVGVELGPDGQRVAGFVGVVRTNALPGYRRPPCGFGCEPSCPPFIRPGGQL